MRTKWTTIFCNLKSFWFFLFVCFWKVMQLIVFKILLFVLMGLYTGISLMCMTRDANLYWSWWCTIISVRELLKEFFFLVTKEVKPYCFQTLIMALFGDYGRLATSHKYVFIFVMYVLFSWTNIQQMSSINDFCIFQLELRNKYMT